MGSWLCWVIGVIVVVGALGVLAGGRPSAIHDPEGYKSWDNTSLTCIVIVIGAGVFLFMFLKSCS